MKESTRNIIMKAVYNYEIKYPKFTWLRYTYKNDLDFLQAIKETFKDFEINHAEGLLNYYNSVQHEAKLKECSIQQLKEISDIILILEGQVL